MDDFQALLERLEEIQGLMIQGKAVYSPQTIGLAIQALRTQHKELEKHRKTDGLLLDAH